MKFFPDSLKISVSGLGPQYTGGDIVMCTLNMQPNEFSFGSKKIESVEVSFSRRVEHIIEKNSNTIVLATGTLDFSRRKQINYDYLSIFQGRSIEELEGKILSGRFTEEVVFDVPKTVSNTFFMKVDNRHLKIDYGVLVRVKIEGQENMIEKFFKTKMNVFVPPEKKIQWCDKKSFTDFRFVARYDLSYLAPGGKITVDFASITKLDNRSVLWATLRYKHNNAETYNYGKHVVTKRTMGKSCKVFKNKESSPDDDYSLLKSTIEKGEGTRMTLTIPKDILGGPMYVENSEVEVTFHFGFLWSDTFTIL